MEAAPDAKPGREGKPPPVPPNYVSLRQLQELRLKEKEQERRRREEEEAAAAAAAKREAEKAARAAAIKREAALKAEQERRRLEEEEAAAAKREAKKAAMAAAVKREAALKSEAKGRAGSWEASGGAKETHRRGRAQGQGSQWVAVAHLAPATTVQPMARAQGAAGNRGAAIGSGDGEIGPDDVPANASHVGGKPLAKKKRMGRGKGKSKEKMDEGALASSHGGGGGKPGEVVPTSSDGGKPESKSESKAKGKGPGDQTGESSSRGGGPGEPAEAAIFSSSRNRSRRREVIHAGARSAEACTGIAMAKAAGPSPERGVKPDGMEKPEPRAPRRADAVAGSDSPDAKKTAPAQAPLTSAADVSSKPASGGDLREEAKPGGLVEGQRRRPMVEAVAELNPRVARYSAGPLSSRRNLPVEQCGRVWVPKTAGSSAGAEL